MNDNLSPADLKAVMGNNDNGFGNDGGWLWLLLILAMMNGGWGNGFGGGFNGGFGNEYAWLSNGQKEIMQNTNNGFDTLQLTNQLNGINSGVQNLSTQLCNCCADMNQTVNSGFANAETAANARQIANMQQAFNNEITTLQGFNGVNNSLCNASAENRLGQANLTATILAENCADRQALSEGVRDIITNQTANTQRIIDEIFRDRLDEKDSKIADLQREISMKDLQASQVAQTAAIQNGFVQANTDLYNLLSNCPVPTTPVYGRTPIFTCNGNGCGCGNTVGNTLV